MPQLITVFAASGRQGAAVVRALLHAGRGVRAVVRDPGRPGAHHLADAGAEVVVGTFDDPEAIAQALHGAVGLFLYQPLHISAEATPGTGPDDELRRGRAVFDAAARAGVEQVVYSSALGADRPDASPLLRPKTLLEDYLRTSGLAATILRPVGFMENYAGSARGLRPSGVLASTAPPDITEQLIAVRDIGSFTALAFAAPGHWIGRELDIAADELTTPQIATAITKATGRRVHYEQIPLDAIRAQDPQRAAVIARMYEAGRPAAKLQECRAANSSLTTFDAWLATADVAQALTAYLSDAEPA